MPVSPDYEWPNCWIRGEMGRVDLEGDEVRQMIQDCPWRKGKMKSFLIGRHMDYVCTNPAVGPTEEVTGARTMADGAVVAGGLSDDYATFCPAVDKHLTSLGEKSRLIYDANFRDVDPPMLGSGE